MPRLDAAFLSGGAVVSARQVLIAALVLALAASGTLWFLAHFERVTDKVWVGFQGKARRDPWLAAQRLIERMGAQAAELHTPSDLRALPTAATLVLSKQRNTIAPPLRAAVLAWVERGGRLIVEAGEEREPDPLLDALGVKRRGIAPGERKRHDVYAEVVEIALPGASAASKVKMRLRPSIESPAAVFRADGKTSTHLLILRRGRGQVTVLNDLAFASNLAIGGEEHAQFLWQLVAAGPAVPVVFFFHDPSKLSLPDWLRAHAWAALAGGAAALLLWLWRIAPRLGPVAPDPGRVRRRLLDHLRASGRFLWANGGAQRLIEAAREACLRRILRAHPDFSAVPEPQRAARLAEILGLPQERAARILVPPTPRRMTDFLHTISLYHFVHERLAYRQARLPSRKTR